MTDAFVPDERTSVWNWFTSAFTEGTPGSRSTGNPQYLGNTGAVYHGDLAAVLRGVDAALAAGFDEVKTNTVVLRGENDDELDRIVAWAWARGITPRFIEVMGVGEGGTLWRDNGVGGGVANNGRLDGTEARLANVVVQLLDNNGAVIATTSTDAL